MNTFTTSTRTENVTGSYEIAEAAETCPRGNRNFVDTRKNLAEAYSHRAVACQERGQYNEAAQAASRAVALDPANADGLRVLARIHLDAGQHEAAQAACRQILQRNPQDAAAQQMMDEAMVQEAKLAENLF